MMSLAGSYKAELT